MARSKMAQAPEQRKNWSPGSGPGDKTHMMPNKVNRSPEQGATGEARPYKNPTVKGHGPNGS